MFGLFQSAIWTVADLFELHNMGMSQLFVIDDLPLNILADLRDGVTTWSHKQYLLRQTVLACAGLSRCMTSRFRLRPHNSQMMRLATQC